MLVPFHLLSSALFFGPPERSPGTEDGARGSHIKPDKELLLGHIQSLQCTPSCHALIFVNKVDLTH